MYDFHCSTKIKMCYQCRRVRRSATDNTVVGILFSSSHYANHITYGGVGDHRDVTERQLNH